MDDVDIGLDVLPYVTYCHSNSIPKVTHYINTGHNILHPLPQSVCNLSLTYHRGTTVLLEACRAGNIELVYYLITHYPSSINVKEVHPATNKTCLSLLISHHISLLDHTQPDNQRLGQLPHTFHQLLQADAPIASVRNQNIPLFISCVLGLLSLGCPLSHFDIYGYSVLDYLLSTYVPFNQYHVYLFLVFITWELNEVSDKDSRMVTPDRQFGLMLVNNESRPNIAPLPQPWYDYTILQTNMAGSPGQGQPQQQSLSSSCPIPGDLPYLPVLVPPTLSSSLLAPSSDRTARVFTPSYEVIRSDILFTLLNNTYQSPSSIYFQFLVWACIQLGCITSDIYQIVPLPSTPFPPSKKDYTLRPFHHSFFLRRFDVDSINCVQTLLTGGLPTVSKDIIKWSQHGLSPHLATYITQTYGDVSSLAINNTGAHHDQVPIHISLVSQAISDIQRVLSDCQYIQRLGLHREHFSFTIEPTILPNSLFMKQVLYTPRQRSLPYVYNPKDTSHSVTSHVPDNGESLPLDVAHPHNPLHYFLSNRTSITPNTLAICEYLLDDDFGGVFFSAPPLASVNAQGVDTHVFPRYDLVLIMKEDSEVGTDHNDVYGDTISKSFEQLQTILRTSIIPSAALQDSVVPPDIASKLHVDSYVRTIGQTITAHVHTSTSSSSSPLTNQEGQSVKSHVYDGINIYINHYHHYYNNLLIYKSTDQLSTVDVVLTYYMEPFSILAQQYLNPPSSSDTSSSGSTTTAATTTATYECPTHNLNVYQFLEWLLVKHDITIEYGPTRPAKYHARTTPESLPSYLFSLIIQYLSTPYPSLPLLRYLLRLLPIDRNRAVDVVYLHTLFPLHRLTIHDKQPEAAFSTLPTIFTSLGLGSEVFRQLSAPDSNRKDIPFTLPTALKVIPLSLFVLLCSRLPPHMVHCMVSMVLDDGSTHLNDTSHTFPDPIIVDTNAGKVRMPKRKGLRRVFGSKPDASKALSLLHPRTRIPNNGDSDDDDDDDDDIFDEESDSIDTFTSYDFTPSVYPAKAPYTKLSSNTPPISRRLVTKENLHSYLVYLMGQLADKSNTVYPLYASKKKFRLKNLFKRGEDSENLTLRYDYDFMKNINDRWYPLYSFLNSRFYQDGRFIGHSSRLLGDDTTYRWTYYHELMNRLYSNINALLITNMITPYPTDLSSANSPFPNMAIAVMMLGEYRVLELPSAMVYTVFPIHRIVQGVSDVNGETHQGDAVSSPSSPSPKQLSSLPHGTPTTDDSLLKETDNIAPPSYDDQAITTFDQPLRDAVDTSASEALGHTQFSGLQHFRPIPLLVPLIPLTDIAKPDYSKIHPDEVTGTIGPMSSPKALLDTTHTSTTTTTTTSTTSNSSKKFHPYPPPQLHHSAPITWLTSVYPSSCLLSSSWKYSTFLPSPILNLLSSLCSSNNHTIEDWIIESYSLFPFLFTLIKMTGYNLISYNGMVVMSHIIHLFQASQLRDPLSGHYACFNSIREQCGAYLLSYILSPEVVPIALTNCFDMTFPLSSAGRANLGRDKRKHAQDLMQLLSSTTINPFDPKYSYNRHYWTFLSAASPIFDPFFQPSLAGIVLWCLTGRAADAFGFNLFFMRSFLPMIDSPASMHIQDLVLRYASAQKNHMLNVFNTNITAKHLIDGDMDIINQSSSYHPDGQSNSQSKSPSSRPPPAPPVVFHQQYTFYTISMTAFSTFHCAAEYRIEDYKTSKSHISPPIHLTACFHAISSIYPGAKYAYGNSLISIQINSWYHETNALSPLIGGSNLTIDTNYIELIKWFIYDYYKFQMASKQPIDPYFYPRLSLRYRHHVNRYNDMKWVHTTEGISSLYFIPIKDDDNYSILSSVRSSSMSVDHKAKNHTILDDVFYMLHLFYQFHDVFPISYADHYQVLLARFETICRIKSKPKKEKAKSQQAITTRADGNDGFDISNREYIDNKQHYTEPDLKHPVKESDHQPPDYHDAVPDQSVVEPRYTHPLIYYPRFFSESDMQQYFAVQFGAPESGYEYPNHFEQLYQFIRDTIISHQRAVQHNSYYFPFFPGYDGCSTPLDDHENEKDDNSDDDIDMDRVDDGKVGEIASFTRKEYDEIIGFFGNGVYGPRVGYEHTLYRGSVFDSPTLLDVLFQRVYLAGHQYGRLAPPSSSFSRADDDEQLPIYNNNYSLQSPSFGGTSQHFFLKNPTLYYNKYFVRIFDMIIRYIGIDPIAPLYKPKDALEFANTNNMVFRHLLSELIEGAPYKEIMFFKPPKPGRTSSITDLNRSNTRGARLRVLTDELIDIVCIFLASGSTSQYIQLFTYVEKQISTISDHHFSSNYGHRHGFGHRNGHMHRKKVNTVKAAKLSLLEHTLRPLYKEVSHSLSDDQREKYSQLIRCIELYEKKTPTLRFHYHFASTMEAIIHHPNQHFRKPILGTYHDRIDPRIFRTLTLRQFLYPTSPISQHEFIDMTAKHIDPEVGLEELENCIYNAAGDFISPNIFDSPSGDVGRVYETAFAPGGVKAKHALQFADQPETTKGLIWYLLQCHEPTYDDLMVLLERPDVSFTTTNAYSQTVLQMAILRRWRDDKLIAILTHADDIVGELLRMDKHNLTVADYIDICFTQRHAPEFVKLVNQHLSQE